MFYLCIILIVFCLLLMICVFNLNMHIQNLEESNKILDENNKILVKFNDLACKDLAKSMNENLNLTNTVKSHESKNASLQEKVRLMISKGAVL